MTAHYRYNAPHQRYVDAQINARVMKLVDMTDSKSVARNSVPVQVRPLVPSIKTQQNNNRPRVGFFVSRDSVI